MNDWIVKCPKCGTHLPEPVFEEVRKGGVVWAWVSKCPKEDCGYLFAQISKRLTKYPSFMGT